MRKRRTSGLIVSHEEEVLLSAIIQNPEEDTLRLVYADLLDEHGDHDRAEFIRLQIRLDSDGAKLPNREYLEARADTLLNRHRREWEGAVRVEGVTDVEFRRGFVDRLTTTTDVFIRAGSEWWSTHPIWHVRLERVIGWIEELVAVPHLDNVRSLWLADEFRGRDLRPLVKSPRPGGAGCFPALEALHVGGWTDDEDFDWNGVSALVACHMPRLRKLHLVNLLDGNRGAAAVAAAPWFAGLDDLDIFTSHVGNAGLTTLLSSRGKNLSDVRIGYSRVSADGLHALVDLPTDPPLRLLSLVGSRTWFYDRKGPLDPNWEIDPDRLGDVLLKHPALELDLKRCPIPQSTQTELEERFGDRVRVGS